MNRYTALLTGALFMLTSCVTNVQSNPARTATEELLISAAAERAATKLRFAIPPHASVFVDNTNFEGTDSKYAIAVIRSHLLEQGVQLVDDKKNADIIIEPRAGALSTDRKSLLFGLPQFNIPIPLASTPLPLPEIAIYGRDEQNGVAKLAITGYYAKKGTLVGAQEPQYGFAHNTKRTVLIFFSWTDSDYLPANVDMSKLDTQEDKATEHNTHVGLNGNGYGPETAASAPAAPAAPSIPAVNR